MANLSGLSTSACLIVLLAALILPAASYYDRAKFKQICLQQSDANDDALELNAQELIKRSGFNYEFYFSVADDGYITQLVSLINPLARQLRGPPVIMFHGANIDMASYVMVSSIEHTPEPFPRTFNSQDGGVKESSNRSLAFTLANNGYDVWLVGWRGSNELNQAYTEHPRDARREGINFRPSKEMFEFAKNNPKKYWNYGLDEVIKFEMRPQIELVRKITKSRQFSIISFSLSTVTTMALMATNPELARDVRLFVQIAPAISADHVYFLDRIYFEKLCPLLPTRGIGFTPSYWLKPAVRSLVVKLSKSKDLRYSLIQTFITSLFGPSLKYNTNLERNVLAHVFQPVSFKSVQQYCQNSVSKKINKFDYGPDINSKVYRSPVARAYDTSSLEVQNWMVISGTNDALADTTTVARLIETTRTAKPPKHVIAPGYNHLDMLAGVEVDKYVVLPLVHELNKWSTELTDLPDDDD